MRSRLAADSPSDLTAKLLGYASHGADFSLNGVWCPEHPLTEIGPDRQAPIHAVHACLTGNGPNSPNNAAFIAAARNAMPKLIAALREARRSAKDNYLSRLNVEAERDEAQERVASLEAMPSERDALRAEVERELADAKTTIEMLNRARNVQHEIAGDVMKERDAAIKERDEARAELRGLKECCASVSELLDGIREQEDFTVELANKSKPVKYTSDTTLRDAITDAPNPEK